MTKKIWFLLVFVLMLKFRGIAQSVSPDVIASCGDFFSNGSGQLQWSMGETMVETYSSANNFITQGFHQPDYGISTGMTNAHIQTPSFYPNPVNDLLTMDFSGFPAGIFAIRIFDLSGKKLSDENISVSSGSDQHVFSMVNYSNGVYLLQISNSQDQLISTLKIVKTN